MSTSAARAVRPTADYLRQLPTLETITQDDWPEVMEHVPPHRRRDFTLELKLVTAEAKYWLCTKGYPEPPTLTAEETGAGYGLRQAEMYVAGYVSIEPRERGPGRAREFLPYGPGETAWFQGVDYWRMLADECERLQRQLKRKHTWELDKQLEATIKEMERVDETLKRMGIR
jgi:hypothetical protein